MTYDRSRARQYQAAIRAVLLTQWDPIGVSQHPEAQDEYDSYVPGVYRLLASREVDRGSLFFHLWQIETERMGLSETPASRQHTYAIVDRLLQLRDAMEQS